MTVFDDSLYEYLNEDRVYNNVAIEETEAGIEDRFLELMEIKLMKINEIDQKK